MLVRPQIRDGFTRSLSVGHRDWEIPPGSVGDTSEAMRLQWLGLAACVAASFTGCGDNARPDARRRPDGDVGSRRPRTRREPIEATAPLVRYCRSVHRETAAWLRHGTRFPDRKSHLEWFAPGPDTMQSSGAIAFSHARVTPWRSIHLWLHHTRMHGTGIVDYGTIGLMPTSHDRRKTTAPAEDGLRP